MNLYNIRLTNEQAKELIDKDFFITKDENFRQGDLIEIIIVNKFIEVQKILYRVTKVEKSPEGLKDGYCILWWEEVIIVRRDRVYPDTKYIKGEV